MVVGYPLHPWYPTLVRTARKKGRVSYSPAQHHEELFENGFSRAVPTDKEQFRVSVAILYHYSVELLRSQ
jgi:hypothetical protein